MVHTARFARSYEGNQLRGSESGPGVRIRWRKFQMLAKTPQNKSNSAVKRTACDRKFRQGITFSNFNSMKVRIFTRALLKLFKTLSTYD